MSVNKSSELMRVNCVNSCEFIVTSHEIEQSRARSKWVWTTWIRLTSYEQIGNLVRDRAISYEMTLDRNIYKESLTLIVKYLCHNTQPFKRPENTHIRFSEQGNYSRSHRSVRIVSRLLVSN